MPFFLSETLATLSAFILLTTLVAAAGAAIGYFLRFPGFAEASRIERFGLALICGFGCTPVLLDFAARFGPSVMTVAALALAALGAPALIRRGEADALLPLGWILAALVWVVSAILIIVDMPGVGTLSHSLLAVDFVKHAAATWSLAESGAPPWNPTMYQPGGAMAYYYLFYTWPAVATVLCAPLGLAARHAAFACAPLMGITLYALAYTVLKQSKADEAVADGAPKRNTNRPLAALLFATGLDLIGLGVIFAAGKGDPEFLFVHFPDWDEQVTSWFNSSMWVPHHIAGLAAAMVGFLALTPPAGDWRRISLAALAFASMVGLSVYVAMPAALGAALWLATLLWRRRFAEAGRLLSAGVLALLLAAPWLATLAPRIGQGGPSPIGFHLRGPQWIDLVAGSEAAGAPWRALAMPLFYFADFGVFALGAFVFWRKAGHRGYANELGLVLVCLTTASFLIGSFLRSQILMNDLGWRVMLFAQLATLVWTAAVWRQGLLFDGLKGAFVASFLTLGYGATVVAVAQLRLFFPIPEMREPLLDEIAAWDWLDRQLPRGSVVQVRPSRDRAYGYGLYGHFPVAIADTHNAKLFGASKAVVEQRMSDLEPIFTNVTLSFDDVLKRAASYNVSALIVSSLDPIFVAPGSWTTTARADYANAHFRVYLLDGSRYENANDHAK